MTTLPQNFPDLDPATLGGTIDSAHWSDLVQRTHLLWALHRARVPGWHWDFESSTSGTDNDLAGLPHLDDYSPMVRIDRPDRDGNVVVGVAALATGCDLSVDVHPVEEGANPAGTSLATLTLSYPTTGLWLWAETTEEIALSSIPDGANLMFRFDQTNTADGNTEIKRIQPFESGERQLDGEDIPTGF